MPVITKKIGDTFRIMEKATGRIAKTSEGNPVDGGGHSSKAMAKRQERAINSRR